MMMTWVCCMTTVRNRRTAYGVTSTLNKASLIPSFMPVRMGMMRMMINRWGNVNDHYSSMLKKL